MVVGRLLSYWEGNFSGAMLNFGRLIGMAYISISWWDKPFMTRVQQILTPSTPVFLLETPTGFGAKHCQRINKTHQEVLSIPQFRMESMLL